ncbi:S1C family serine protease [Flavonifractor plautii]|nr:S1C family serine protease [Flavonifractor plautii]
MIGIVSAKLSSSSNSEASVEGLGFAIPINDVKDMVTSIIEHGYVTGKPNVGILMKDVPQEAQQYGVPASEVLAVLDGSGARSRRAILSPLSTAPQCRAARPSKPPSRTVRRAIR